MCLPLRARISPRREGNRIGRTLENGAQSAYTYDAASRLLGVTHGKGEASLMDVAYGLNAVGARVSRLENGASESYAYDAAGNRLSVTGNAPGAGSYSANAVNQYVSAMGKVLIYDGNGNLAKLGLDTEYTYDALNRLVRVETGGHVVEFAYDCRNRQVSRSVDGVATFFIWDQWSLIEERDASGGQIARYVHGAGIDELLCKIDTSGALYYHQDGLNNTVALTDESGSLVERYQYDAFGSVTIFDGVGAQLAASDKGNRFLFTGREWISEAGVYDYRNRVYSPELGRFLQTDPIRFAAGDGNMYRYVHNNPSRFLDPIGLCEGDKDEKGSKDRKKDGKYDPSDITDPDHPCHDWKGNGGIRPDTDEGPMSDAGVSPVDTSGDHGISANDLVTAGDTVQDIGTATAGVGLAAKNAYLTTAGGITAAVGAGMKLAGKAMGGKAQ